MTTILNFQLSLLMTICYLSLLSHHGLGFDCRYVVILVIISQVLIVIMWNTVLPTVPLDNTIWQKN